MNEKACKTHKRPLRKLKDGREICPICENPFFNEVWEFVFKKNKNVLIVIEGEPGDGKSYLSDKIGEDMDPEFFERIDLTPEILKTRVIYKPATFAKILNEDILYRGAVIIIEEGGIQADHRKWFTFNNMLINYILQTFRFMKLIVVFNVPIIDYIDSDSRKLFKFHIETLRVDYKNNQNVFKVKKQKYNSTTKKIYRTFLRYKVKGQLIKFHRWRTNKPNKLLCRCYEKIHTEFKRELIKELTQEVAILDKDVAAQKKRRLVNEEEAVKKVLNNKDIFTKDYAGKILVDRATVESEFGIGRAIAERIKKRAERLIHEGGDPGKL